MKTITVGQIPNFGIDETKLAERGKRSRYTTNGGKEITKSETNRLLRGDGELPDEGVGEPRPRLGPEGLVLGAELEVHVVGDDI